MAIFTITEEVFAENIALKSYGGTSLYTGPGEGPYYIRTNTQWSLFDGSTTDTLLNTPNHKTNTIARCWYRTVTISNINLYKSSYSSDIYHPGKYEQNIKVRYRHDGLWSNVYDGSSMYSTNITITLSQPVSADALEVEALSPSGKYLYLYDIQVGGTLAGDPVTPENIAVTNYGGSWSANSPYALDIYKCFDGKVSINSEIYAGRVNRYNSTTQYLERVWNKPVRIYEIASSIYATSYANYANFDHISYKRASDGVWVELPHTYMFFGNGGGTLQWVIGKNFDTPVIATAVRINGFGGSENKWKYIPEVYVYGSIINGTLIIIK